MRSDIKENVGNAFMRSGVKKASDFKYESKTVGQTDMREVQNN